MALSEFSKTFGISELVHTLQLIITNQNILMLKKRNNLTNGMPPLKIKNLILKKNLRTIVGQM